MTCILRTNHPCQTLRHRARVAAGCARVQSGFIGNMPLAINESWQVAIKTGVARSIQIHHACATPSCTDQHHAITAGGHASISTAKSWLVSAKEAIKLFSYNAGIKLVSAAANVDAQALSKSLHILAKLRITQTAENITFTAKEELRINGGTSFSILNASGITHGTGGQWEVKAATQALETGKSMAVVMPQMPSAAVGPYASQYQFFKDDGRPSADYAWQTLSGTQVLEAGKTEAQGQGAQANTEDATATQARKARRRESERIAGDWQSQLDQKAGS